MFQEENDLYIHECAMMNKAIFFLIMTVTMTAILQACTRYPEYSAFTYDFENGIRGWEETGCIKIMQDRQKHHSGMSSLKIAGALPKGYWSFVESRKIKIHPGKRYRFSGWMLIDAISENTSFFKCALWGPDRWLKNIDSNWYDMGKKGEWQKLTAEFETPEEAEVMLSYFVEKRPSGKDVAATIFIDDLSLEMIGP